jgi:S1-C subfamily serine protease
MARKIIPYPCDYKTTASVRRARRGGNAFVIILCILIAVLLGAGAYFALTDDYRAIKSFETFLDKAEDSILNRGSAPDQPQPSSAIDSQAQQPAATATPVETPAPTETPNVTEAPTKTPMPIETPVLRPTVAPATPVVPRLTPAPSPDPTYEERMAKPFATEAFANLSDIVDACQPGVVGILNYQPYSLYQTLKPTYSGTGFILTADGYIVTNEHVIEDARKLTVVLSNGEEMEAKLVGSDVMSDVAVLKIEAQGLTPLPIGDSSSIRVGEFVLAIGNPISTNELYGSVTFGIISAIARQINIDGFENEFLQTDAAINPGNSGGPLLNMNGEVIGVTNAKYFTAGYDEYGNTLHSEGIGFALPMNNVMTIVDSLIKNGSVPRPGIGVKVGTLSPEEAALQNRTPGIYVDSVTEGGPADVAGMKAGDIILKLDGKELTQDEMISLIRTKKIGERITFTVLRGTETLEIVITVGDLNQMN